jgi:eukaryotic-like serine/threonine-protein kinase
MTLTTGSRLGPYEVLGPIGAGGMGEVYKARDTRLDRTVAIKVLPSHLSANPDLKARFEREAKAISSLSHPNICTLHDVGHQDGVDFLVMEYLEGESLATRLTRGPLPIEQVQRIGGEIAVALDAAHRSGIVHRDLKPGNIVLTRAGAKLLDFGLAKTAAGPVAGSAIEGLTSLPTEAAGAMPLTTEGTLLGTFQYMAPEQLEGKEADARTDIFALGAVLYEMVTGKPAFAGGSRASLISSIMSSQPQSVTAVQPMTPPALERLIRTCLAKDPNDRWQTAHDVALQLQWIAEGGSAVGLPAPVSARRARREHFAWAIAALGVLGMAFLAWRGGGSGGPARQLRFTIPVPHGVSSIDLPRISPDGATLAFNATDSSGRSMIWLRPLNSLDANPLPGTEGATRPFWSPDSRFLGFVAGGKLKKIAASGGPAEVVCDAATGSDGTWGRNGDILFDGNASADPIRHVMASGGIATAALPFDSTFGAGWPAFLPDGKHFFYTKMQSAKTEIMLGTLGATRAKSLGVAVSRIEYSADGYLLFVRDQTLVAQRFNSGSGRLEGDPFPVAESLPIVGTAQADFSVSNNGVLVYRATGGATSRLVWLDRSGREVGQVGPSAEYRAPALSPDGRFVAVRRRDPGVTGADVWIMDPARGTTTRFTFDPAVDSNPLWSPDGERLVWYSNRGGADALWIKSASGMGQDEKLVNAPGAWPEDWSRDGQTLLYDIVDPKNGYDMYRVSITGDRKPVLVLQTPFNEGREHLSPDGRWLAYESDESGRQEVYVMSFEGQPGKWQVSANGGKQARWSPDGRELFYLSGDQRLMSVAIPAGPSFNPAMPVPLFKVNFDDNTRNAYCVAPDGKRFLFLLPDQELMTPITAIVNWRAGLGRK